MSAPLQLTFQSVIGTADGAVLTNLLIILIVAGGIALLMQRIRMATVPGYLIAGALLGPHALGLVSSTEEVQSVGHLAIILLLFGIGLNMELSVLGSGIRRMLIAAVASILGCIALLWPLAMLLGLDAPGALVVAMSLSLSSTAVVLRLLQDRREMGRTKGRLSLAILVVQDLAVIVMLILLEPLSVWQAGSGGGGEGSTNGLIALIRNSALGLLGVGVLIAFGRIVLPRLLHEAARAKSGEILIVCSTAFAIGAAAVTAGLGLSPELGAFLGGVLLSSTPFRHSLSGQINTLRDLFIAVFFTSLGMHLDLQVVVDYWFEIFVGSVLLILIKTNVISLSCWVVGTTARTSLETAIGLSQAGEFALVLLGVAADMALLDSQTTATIIAIIVITLILTPTMIASAGRVAKSLSGLGTAPWNDTPAFAEADEGDESGAKTTPKRHAIVAGYGLVGRAMVDQLASMQMSTTIIELNPRTVRKQSQLRRPIVYGDVSHADVLRAAGIERATVLLLTIPDEEAVLAACQSARQLNPDVFIVARTNFMSKGMLARGLGANAVVVEEVATAEAMCALIRAKIGTASPSATGSAD